MTYEATVLLYFSLFFISCSLIDTNSRRVVIPLSSGRNIDVTLIIGLAIPIVLAALRYWVGADWGTYYNQFIRAIDESWTTVFNDGYFGCLIYVLRKITALTKDYRVYFGALSALAVIPTYCAFRKHENNDIRLIFFLWLTMHYLFSFNIGKQYIAIAFGLCAFECIFEGKLKMFLIFSIIAIGFHPSGIMLLPIYFIWDQEERRISNKPTTYLLVFAFIFLTLYFQNIMGIFSEATEMSRYTVYTTTDTSGSNLSLVFKMIIFAVELLFYNNVVEFDERNRLFYVLQAFDLIISVTGYSSPAFKRCGLFYSVTNIYLLSSLQSVVSDNQKKWMKILLYLFGMAYCILYFYVLEQGHAMPYRIAVTSYEEIINQINQIKWFGN